MDAITVVVAARERSRRAACLNVLRTDDAVAVVGEAHTALGLLRATLALEPRIVLLDGGLAARVLPALLGILGDRSRARVLLITEPWSARRVVEALSCGARGHLERRLVRARLGRAVHALAEGQAWVPRKLVSPLIARLRRIERTGPRSHRPRSNGQHTQRRYR